MQDIYRLRASRQGEEKHVQETRDGTEAYAQLTQACKITQKDRGTVDI